MIRNAKPSGYYFYMNLNIWGDFQICISVPLKYTNKKALNKNNTKLIKFFLTIIGLPNQRNFNYKKR